MIRVRVEIVPHGNELLAREIGRAEIANVGGGEISKYRARFGEDCGEFGFWPVDVGEHERSKGFWPLVAQVVARKEAKEGLPREGAG